MTEQAYLENSQKTEKPLPKDMALIHSALGIADEVGEIVKVLLEEDYNKIDWVNLQEEIGDCLWFIAIPQRMFNLRFEKILPNKKTSKFDVFTSVTEKLTKLVAHSAEYVGLVKKTTIYGKEETKEIISKYGESLYHVVEILKELAELSGSSLEQIRVMNYQKLMKRYDNGGYNKDKAINRDLESERSALEQTTNS